MATNRPAAAPLFAVESVDPPRAPGRRRTGRHEKSLNRTIQAAGLTTSVAAARVSLLRSLACALDRAEGNADVYGTAQAARVYFDALERAGLMGAAVQDGDELDGLDEGPSLEDDDDEQ